MTTITQTQNIECQMVEFDETVRYMRIRTPSVPQRVWFLPTYGGGDELFRFVLLDQDKCRELEELYQQQGGKA